MPDFPQCTAEQVVEVAEAVAIAASATNSEDIAKYLNHPKPAVERALNVAEALGLLSQKGGVYEVTDPYGFYFSDAGESRRIDVLRFALEAFSPYRFFKQRIALHRDPLKAARETKHRFQYDNHEGEIRETLVSLGQFSGSLVYGTDTGYVVATSAETEAFLAAAEQISLSGASIEDFIRERLGAEAYAYVQDEEAGVITHVRSALQKIVAGDSDRSTVVHIGNAAENFLVKLGSMANPVVNLSGANGVTSKAQQLKDKKVIADKHMGYFRFLGHLRNAADHGQDPDVGMEWTITPEGVLLGAFALLAAIRSVVALNVGKKAEF